VQPAQLKCYQRVNNWWQLAAERLLLGAAMSVFSTLESKLARFAIPNLVRVIVVFQVLSWVLIKAVPQLRDTLMFDSDLIKEGEVWRVASYILLPGSPSILWLLFAIPWGWMISDGLEEGMGSFRVNLYVFGGMLAVALGGLLFGYATTGGVLWTTLMLAYAVYFPNQEILLMAVIPMKIKWLAWIAAGSLVFAFLGVPNRRQEILFSLLNFAVAFGPGMVGLVKHRVRVAERRQRYASAQIPAGESIHRCERCGKTEKDDPHLDFRVTAQGEDICSNCRAAAKA
jgi:hypothetical protein